MRDKKCFLLVLVFITFVFCFYFFVIEKKEDKYLDIQGTKTTDAEEWNAYYDGRYGFLLDYPSQLGIHSMYEEKQKTPNTDQYVVINGGVIFFQKDFYSIITIRVLDNIDINSIDEWAEKENRKIEHQEWVIEKKTKIDGYDAIIAHAASVFSGQREEFKEEKRAVFIKDGKLFEINTRGIDHEKIWSNFKFTKQFPLF